MVLLENTRGGTINPLSRYDSIIPSGTSGSAVAEKRRNRPRKLATTVNSSQIRSGSVQGSAYSFRWRGDPLC